MWCWSVYERRLKNFVLTQSAKIVFFYLANFIGNRRHTFMFIILLHFSNYKNIAISIHPEVIYLNWNLRHNLVVGVWKNAGRNSNLFSNVANKSNVPRYYVQIAANDRTPRPRRRRRRGNITCVMPCNINFNLVQLSSPGTSADDANFAELYLALDFLRSIFKINYHTEKSRHGSMLAVGAQTYDHAAIKSGPFHATPLPISR